MRIVTYNIHGWRTADGKPNLDGVAEVLRQLDADIIGLNEVFYPRVVAGDDHPALEALAARLGMHFVFGPCLRWPAEQDMPARAYGNALLSRWPIIAPSAAAARAGRACRPRMRISSPSCSSPTPTRRSCSSATGLARTTPPRRLIRVAMTTCACPLPRAS